jgi:hypothetical protein
MTWLVTRPLKKEMLHMAFADPQSVTINAVAQTLPRVENLGARSIYRKDDGTVSLTVSHQKVAGRSRRMIRLDHSKIATDVFTSDNLRYNTSVWLVADVPDQGYTIAEQKQIVDALTAYLTASTGARVTQLLGGES